MDVEDVVIGMVVDHGPLLDRAETNALIDASRIEAAAVDQEAELLVGRGRRDLRLAGAERDRPPAGDLVVADRGERRPAGSVVGSCMASGSPSTTTWASGPIGDG